MGIIEDREKSYIDIAHHYENCFKTYGDNTKGVDWPNEKDAMTRYKVMMDIVKFNQYIGENGEAGVSLLDFGCGLGHLYEFILKNDIKVDYTGLDISSVFVEKCREKYPDTKFVMGDLLADDGFLLLKYDYIVMNGVFTEKRELTYEKMLSYFKQLVLKVYDLCNKGMAFNVMSKDVDWERDDLFHLPLNTLSDFITKEVTRDFIIRNDYGLYEYTVYVYRR